MYCIKCGTELPIGTRFCTNCGCQVPTKWIPVQAQKTKKKFNYTPIIILLFGLVVLMIAVMNNADHDKYRITESQRLQNVGFSDEQINEVRRVLDLADFPEIKSVKLFADEEKYKVYEAAFDGFARPLMICFDENGKLTEINVKLSDWQVYAYGIIDVKYIPKDMQDSVRTSAQLLVEGILSAPKTAKFPNISQWSFRRDSEGILVQSFVDSKNALGVEIRSEFTIVFDESKNLKTFIVNGQKIK